jgi:hypothetical protein
MTHPSWHAFIVDVLARRPEGRASSPLYCVCWFQWDQWPVFRSVTWECARGDVLCPSAFPCQSTLPRVLPWTSRPFGIRPRSLARLARVLPWQFLTRPPLPRVLPWTSRPFGIRPRSLARLTGVCPGSSLPDRPCLEYCHGRRGHLASVLGRSPVWLESCPGSSLPDRPCLGYAMDVEAFCHPSICISPVWLDSCPGSSLPDRPCLGYAMDVEAICHPSLVARPSDWSLPWQFPTSPPLPRVLPWMSRPFGIRPRSLARLAGPALAVPYQTALAWAMPRTSMPFAIRPSAFRPSGWSCPGSSLPDRPCPGRRGHPSVCISLPVPTWLESCHGRRALFTSVRLAVARAPLDIEVS